MNNANIIILNIDNSLIRSAAWIADKHFISYCFNLYFKMRLFIVGIEK